MERKRRSRMRRAGQAAMVAVALMGVSSRAGATEPSGVTESSTPPPYVLDPVVVTPTRSAEDPLDVPAAVDRIDREDISRAQPRLNLAESLPRVPGVLARDRQNQAQDIQISIRGFGARSTFGVRGVRLYSDGIPATMPDGQGQVSHFSLDAIDRIEVLRGPFSALYGNSSGGVIQLFSADPPAGLQWRAGPFVGAEGLARGGLGISGPWNGKGSAPPSGGFSVDGMASNDEGFRNHSAARRGSGQALLRGGIGEGSAWTVVANGLDVHADDPQGLTASEVAADPSAASPGALAFDTRKTTRQRQLGARLEVPLAGTSRIVAGAYAGSRAIEQYLSVPVAAQSNPLNGGGVVDLDRDFFGLDARFRWREPFHANGLALTVGLEGQVSDERRRGYENFVGTELGVRGAIRRDENDRVGGADEYAQLEWALSERWRADLGVRHSEIRFRSSDFYITPQNPDDSGERTFQETSPVLGVVWRPTTRWSLYANAGRGFETPTFAELAYRADSLSGLNTELRSSSSDNFEVGLRSRRDRDQLGICLFLARTEDELVVASSQGGRTTYSNAPGSRRRGAELSWSVEPSAHWRGTFAYTYLDATFRESFGAVRSGDRIPGVPRHDLWAEWRWLPGSGFDFGIAASALDRVWANDANTASAPGYARVDVSAEWRRPVGGAWITAFLRGNNMLDRDVIGSVIVNESNGRYFEPAPGRAWLAGITVGSSR